MPERSWTALILAAAAALLAGCGPGSPRMVEVSGIVKLKGQPIDKIRVEFNPTQEGPISTGLTDEDGRYTLNTQDGTAKGAVVGKHKIVLRDASIVTKFLGRNADEKDPTEGRKSRITTKYGDAMATPLEVEVTPDKRTFEFDVEPYVPFTGAKKR